MRDDTFGTNNLADAEARQKALDNIQVPDTLTYPGEQSVSEEVAQSSTMQKSGQYELPGGSSVGFKLLFTQDYDDFIVWTDNVRPDNPDLTDIKARLRVTGGNIQPALARKIHDPSSQAKYEIIYGGRRYRACAELGFKFMVIVLDELSDDIALKLTHEENQARLDDSPLDLADYYLKVASKVREKSEDKIKDYEIAAMFDVKPTYFAKYKAIAQLPEWLTEHCPKRSIDAETGKQTNNWAFASSYSIARLVDEAQRSDIDLQVELASRRFNNSDELLKAIRRALNKTPTASSRKMEYAEGRVIANFGKTKGTLKLEFKADADQQLKDEVIALIENYEKTRYAE